GRFKDYIGVPKSNHYQSLHTTVVGPQGEHVEFQIRTYEMHRVAEEGIAAHWTYKEQGEIDETEKRVFTWLRQLLESHQDVTDNRQFMESVKLDLYSDVPHRDWLKFVRTPRDKNKIKHWLRVEEAKRSLELGKRLLERELRRHNVALGTLLKTTRVQEVARESGLPGVDELFTAIGY